MLRVSPGKTLFSAVLMLAILPGTSAPAAGQQPPPAGLREDPPKTCPDCAEWNGPREPFRVFGNTWFVGPAGLSSVLVVSDQGLILLDGGLSQSAAVIERNIRALGFSPADIKLITTSHGHFDHVGGIRALQRLTGATVLASDATARALAAGRPVPEDPQFEAASDSQDFPTLDAPIRVVRDGELVRLGNVTLTAHSTPGHTPGATTWSWRACEGPRCLNFVYADSLSAISNATFRFTGDATHPSLVDAFRRSIEKIAELPCDVLITTHPAAAGLDEKLARRRDTGIAPGAPGDPFVTPEACRAYAENARRNLDARVKKEDGSEARPK
ncbi:MAG: subclass B3 metallo-beta-lactamase [Vicinamibacterales bacterium]